MIQASDAAQEPGYVVPASSLRLGDNAAALALLDEWMADETGYDERVWPQVRQMIEENRLSERRRFCD